MRLGERGEISARNEILEQITNNPCMSLIILFETDEVSQIGRTRDGDNPDKLAERPGSVQLLIYHFFAVGDVFEAGGFVELSEGDFVWVDHSPIFGILAENKRVSTHLRLIKTIQCVKKITNTN